MPGVPPEFVLFLPSVSLYVSFPEADSSALIERPTLSVGRDIDSCTALLNAIAASFKSLLPARGDINLSDVIVRVLKNGSPVMAGRPFLESICFCFEELKLNK